VWESGEGREGPISDYESNPIICVWKAMKIRGGGDRGPTREPAQSTRKVIFHQLGIARQFKEKRIRKNTPYCCRTNRKKTTTT